MGKFVVKEVKTGFKFDLKATNGQVIASSEIYKDKGIVFERHRQRYK